MQNLNFLTKFYLALFFFVFALWYDSIIYNAIIISILLLWMIAEKISPFRFPRQIFIFSLFLFFIFAFQSLNGYGKIWIRLPYGLTVTESGLSTAFKFVTQILLIFLLFGAAIYSSKQEEILYYFRKVGKSHKIIGQKLGGYFRVGLFAFYMVPKSFKIQQGFSSKIKSDQEIKSQKIVARAKIVMDYMYQFIYAVIKNSEKEYPEFIIRSSKSTGFIPKPLLTYRSGLAVLIALFAHGLIIWQH